MKKGGNKIIDERKIAGGKKGGDGILTAAAIPAVLITANHFYNNKSKRKSKRKTGGMGLSTNDQLMSITNSINQMQSQILPVTPSGTINSNTSETRSIVGGGGGILETVAVPAVLLTANQLYRPRKTLRKVTRKRGKRSRRYSVKNR